MHPFPSLKQPLLNSIVISGSERASALASWSSVREEAGSGRNPK